MPLVNKKEAIKTIIDIMKEKGSFPTAVEVADSLFIPMNQVHKVMKALVEAGYLLKSGNWYKLSNNKETQIEFNKKPIEVTDDTSITIIKVTMGIIGVGAVIISIYYTTIWLLEFLNFFLATLLSTIMVGFSVSVFETVMVLLSQDIAKNTIIKFSIPIVLFLLWAMVTGFSIMSTVAGQYNQRTENIQQKGSNTSKVILLSIQEEKSSLQERISQYKLQINNLNKILTQMSSIEQKDGNKRTWYETNWRLKRLNKDYSKLSEELSSLREKERKYVEENRDSVTSLNLDNLNRDKDFYSWVGSVLSINREKVQFWMSLFPAVFVDIIAPIALAIALLLKRRIDK